MKTLAHLPHKDRIVVKGLNREAADRTLDEQEHLREFFWSIKCFDDIEMTHHDMNRIINSMELSFIRSGKALFYIGEDSDSFYIVLHGKVELYLPNPNIDSLKKQKKMIEDELEKINKNIQIIQEDRLVNTVLLNDELDKLKKKRTNEISKMNEITFKIKDMD